MSTRSLVLGGVAVAAIIAIAIAIINTGGGADTPVESQATVREARIAFAVAPKPHVREPDIERWLGGLLDGNGDPGTAHEAILAALARDPVQTLAVLERFLHTADPKQAATRTAVGAIVAFGSPAAQQMLVRTLDARVTDAPLVKLIVPTLGFLTTPSEATEAAVRALALDGAPPATRTTAHLTLGVMASRLDGPRGTAIVGDYAARLARARTPEEQRSWLGVLGNAGTPAAAAAIAPLLADGDPQLRARALEALRRVDSPETDRQLTRALDDADARVRGAAAWSLSYRKGTPEMLAAMGGKLAGEADDTVAAALLDAIWMSRPIDQERVMATVRTVADTHPSEATRKRARSLLAAG